MKRNQKGMAIIFLMIILIAGSIGTIEVVDKHDHNRASQGK